MLILTGGAGFISANLMRQLNRLGFTDILIVDNVAKSRKWANLVGALSPITSTPLESGVQQYVEWMLDKKNRILEELI
jgi:hypothetical protein